MTQPECSASMRARAFSENRLPDCAPPAYLTDDPRRSAARFGTHPSIFAPACSDPGTRGVTPWSFAVQQHRRSVPRRPILTQLNLHNALPGT